MANKKLFTNNLNEQIFTGYHSMQSELDRPVSVADVPEQRATPTPSRARVLPVSWWHVIVDLERHGYTHSAIAGAIGGARTTVEGWKNRHAEPRHDDGEHLIALWRVVTNRSREDLPLRVDGVLSAAQLR